MNYTPVVSILMPTYNQDRYLAEAIKSVLAQTYPHWELIIVDDGSEDSTPDIVTRHRDPRIYYVRRQHSGLAGLAAAYNAGLARARGDLIAILEGDDCWPPWKLELQGRALSRSDAVLSYGKVEVLGPGGQVIGDLARWIPKDRGMRENRPVGTSLGPLLTRFFTYAVGLLIRREALVRIGGFIQPPGVFVVDLPTVVELARIGHFAFVDDVVGYWRRHRKQTTFLRREDAVGLRRYCADRARQLANEGFPLDERVLGNLEKAVHEVRDRVALGSVRILLADRCWREARELSRAIMIRASSETVKLLALGCWIASVCRFDVEWLARWLGRVGLPSDR
jgi:glycosyltransferase involved in cell wall biosynthesis